EIQAEEKTLLVLQGLNVLTIGAIQEVTLVGKNQPRKIRAKLSGEVRSLLLQRCKQLRNSEHLNRIYINKDLTRAKQELLYKERVALREELKKRQEDNPNTQFQIRGRKIVEV